MGINVPRQVDYWRAGSEEDLAAALSLLEKGHVRHALFFAHLSLEKLLKAHACAASGQVAPRIHNLVLLSQRCGLVMDESRTEFLADMDRFSLSGRYPDPGTPAASKPEAEDILSQIQEMLKWLVLCRKSIDGWGATGSLPASAFAEQHGQTSCPWHPSNHPRQSTSAAIASVIQRYLGEVERAGIPVEAGVLFGSYAKGLEREDSDIDLVVVSPRFDQQKTQHDISVLWRLRARTDARIEPIAAGVREFAEDEGSPILCVARSEGIMIPYPAER